MDIAESTQINKSSILSIDLEYVIATPEKQEELRTTIKKAKFLECFSKSMGVILDACAEAGIDRTTYYLWRRNDPQFVKDVAETAEIRNSYVEDKLFQKIEQGDTSSIRFYLNAKHGDYKKKIVNEVFDGERTLEDIIAEQKRRNIEIRNSKQNATIDNGGGNPDRQHVIDDGAIANPQQAGAASSVHTEHGTDVLLGTQDTPKSDNQGTSVGTIENH